MELLIPIIIILGIVLTLRDWSRIGALSSKNKRAEVGAASDYLSSLFQLLSNLGVKVSLLSEAEEQPWMKGGWGEGSRSERILKLEDRNIDYIFVNTLIAVDYESGYVMHPPAYFLTCIVKSPNWPPAKTRKKTELAKKLDPEFMIQDLRWKGDKSLADILNRDVALKQMLIADPDVNRYYFNLAIYPKPEFGCYHLRGWNVGPDPRVDFFDTLDLLAKRLKMRS